MRPSAVAVVRGSNPALRNVTFVASACHPPTLCRLKTDFSLAVLCYEDIEAWASRGRTSGREMGTDEPERAGGASSNDIAHLDGRRMHELSAVNYHLGQYVLRHYDADAGRVEPVTIADERALADSVATAAEAIRTRAERRERLDGDQR